VLQRDGSAFTFRVYSWLLDPEDVGKMARTTHPMTQHHIQEDLIFQHHCESLKSGILLYSCEYMNSSST